MTSHNRVAVLGLWHLGSVTAACWASIGRHVTGWDPDPVLRAQLAAGKPPVREPGLDAMVAEAFASGRLNVAATISDALAAADIVHVAYDSQVDAEGGVDDDRIEEAIDAVASSAPAGCLVLLTSQVPVGTSRRLHARLEAAGRGDVLFACVPENLRLGSAVADFREPARLIVGVDDERAWAAARSALRGVAATPRRMNLPSAELAKHATNAYLALCIAFANELATIAGLHGAAANDVADALRDDPRVSPTAPLRPGAAFSGATLQRDLVALVRARRAAERPDLFATVLAVNDRHARVPLQLLRAEFGYLAGRTLAVLGLAYKPGTSTLRDSLPLRLVREFAAAGAKVRGYDPDADEVADPPAGFLRCPTLSDCLSGADATVVLSPLAEATALGWLSLPTRRRLVVDGCGGLDEAAVNAGGWRYLGVSQGDP